MDASMILQCSVNWVKDVDFTLSGSPDPACAGDDVVLSVNSTDPNLTYYWSTGATGTSITVQNAGFYTVTGMNPQGVSMKSFEVPFRPVHGSTGCHTSCFGDLIEAPTGHGYTWFYDDDPDVNPPGDTHQCNWPSFRSINRACTSFQ